MDRTILLSLAICAGAFAQQGNLRDAFVMDGHVHIINRQFYQGGEITDSYPDGQVDVPRIRKGGLKAIFFSLFSSEEYYARRFEVRHTLDLMDLALRQLEKHHDQIELALTASDIQRINKAGKIAAVLDLEGGFDLDGDLGVLRDLYRLGLRSAMLSSHNFTNNFADSCCAPAKWNGINDKGRAVIREDEPARHGDQRRARLERNDPADRRGKPRSGAVLAWRVAAFCRDVAQHFR